MAKGTSLKFGIEEEVFATNPEHTSLQSMYSLAKLLWSNPRFYYTHSASNFARGRDLAEGVMAGLEISTAPCSTPAEAVSDLRKRRTDLSKACCGQLIVPLGQLLGRSGTTNTCGLHVHVSGIEDIDKAYNNLVRFLPLLTCMTLNSPAIQNNTRILSLRVAQCFAIGTLTENKWYRFQDIIISKRLKTLEIRVFDPFWDLERLTVLLECIRAIVTTKKGYSANIEEYNNLRKRIAYEGYDDKLRPLWLELNELYSVPESLFETPPAVETLRYFHTYGKLVTYASLDHAYRTGTLKPIKSILTNRQNALEFTAKVIAGLVAYYLVRAPYSFLKFIEES